MEIFLLSGELFLRVRNIKKYIRLSSVVSILFQASHTSHPGSHDAQFYEAGTAWPEVMMLNQAC